MTQALALLPGRLPERSQADYRVLQRSCGCGSSGCCHGARAEDPLRALGLQTKLTIGSASDPMEAEADRVASQVLSHTSVHATPSISALQRSSDAVTQAVPASVDTTLAGHGAELPAGVRSDMESRFGHDFSQVRIHADATAARSAQELSAHAYTVGHDIAFGPGQYAPGTSGGRALLAHELTHVVQQGRAAPSTVQRAVMKLGPVSVNIDYSGLPGIQPALRADKIVAQITALTGSAPDALQDSAVRALTSTAQEWLMYALDLLEDNPVPGPSLSKLMAVDRLRLHASSAIHAPLAGKDRAFETEALTVAGWSEVALANQITKPIGKEAKAIDKVVNPPSSGGAASGKLDAINLDRRLSAALTHLVLKLDPANWKAVGKRSMPAFERLGNIVQEEARSFFSPYSDAARASVFNASTPWHASANIFDTGTLVPDTKSRLSYLRNRAEIVGRNTDLNAAMIDTDIFADTNFDSTRPADRKALQSILDSLEQDAKVQPAVDRLIQHTGRQTGSGGTNKIGLVSEFNASTADACTDHWRGIDTLCHEVLHALVHPDFSAASARVKFPQVMREGFTEVLGVQLFNDRVVPKANSDAAFKASMEQGVTGAPCSKPALATIGYGAAGAGAEDIRAKAGDNNFRAAYFLGRPELAGIKA